jgi:ArsR family transcriptional regulator, arsenate/arsenite/antimonite-responsive transcriptional repressor
MKTKDYSEKHYKIAGITKLFGHPARIQLLEILLKKGYVRSEDMAKGFPIAFTSVSQHLKEFREHGLVYKKYVDSGIAYYFNEEKFSEMKNNVCDFFSTPKAQ